MLFSEPIVPKKGETSAAMLRALDRDFHPECFKCEVGISDYSDFPMFVIIIVFMQDCGLVLDSRVSGSECYPVDNKPLCAKCSKNRQT